MIDLDNIRADRPLTIHTMFKGAGAKSNPFGERKQELGDRILVTVNATTKAGERKKVCTATVDTTDHEKSALELAKEFGRTTVTRHGSGQTGPIWRSN